MSPLTDYSYPTMKHLALALTCMLIFLDTSPANATAPTEIILKTEAANKPALFPHAKHQSKIECDACHKDANFPTDKNWDMKKGHALCLGCHKAKNQGAVKCDGCHK